LRCCSSGACRATPGLDGRRAAFATLFFVLAAPITSAHYVTANGGNVEPCLYILLFWTLRRRPVWLGLVLPPTSAFQTGVAQGFSPGPWQP
jgi:hypothetical protein